MNDGSIHLLLVRHGEMASGSEPDSPLSARGREQARRVADRLRRARPDRLISSTLLRASETATTIGEVLALDVDFDPRLREVGTCRGDGSPFPTLPRDQHDFNPRDHPFQPLHDGAESWIEFRHRVGEVVGDLLDADGERSAAIVVCHGGVVDALLENITGAVSPGPIEVALAHTGVTHLEYQRGLRASPWILHHHNDVSHLEVAAGTIAEATIPC